MLPLSTHLFSLVVTFKIVAFIRQDLAGGRFLAQLSAEEQLELAGLAIRAEFGEFIDLIHGGGDYFSLHHYLPEAVRYNDSTLEEKEWPGGELKDDGVKVGGQVCRYFCPCRLHAEGEEKVVVCGIFAKNLFFSENIGLVSTLV
jgi:hypothetical protein